MTWSMISGKSTVNEAVEREVANLFGLQDQDSFEGSRERHRKVLGMPLLFSRDLKEVGSELDVYLNCNPYLRHLFFFTSFNNLL